MNFTRWSARLPGTQRRAAARDDRSPVPAARAEYAQAQAAATLPDGTLPAPPDTASAPTATGPALDDLSAREILGRLPVAVALLHGPDHRVAYVNEAYETAFGPRPCGAPAAETLPELAELSVLPLLDQVLRSGTARTVKSRRTAGGSSYTVTCTPVAPWTSTEATGTGNPKTDRRTEAKTDGKGDGRADGKGEGGVLVYAADVTDHAEAAERLRTSERRHRETAVTLQRSLLPQELEQPDDLRIAATYQPGGTDAAVGGDWYDVITLGAGRTALVIGDVMGRGVRAAAVMGQLRTAVRAYARLDLPPHEVIQLLDVLASEIDATQIATCVYAVHDPNEGQLVYASAGHLPILVRDEDGTVERAADPTGPPLGTGGWIHTSGTIALPPGSTAVLYTDGLVERRSEDIDEGVASLARALSGAKGSPQVVCDRLIRSLGVTAEHDDDVAVLVVQHPARTGADAELFHNAALDLLGGIEAAPRARAFATGVLTSWRFPAELRDLGVLATSELVANSLQHGTPPMRLGLRRTDRRLIIEVTDGDDHLPRRRQAEPADEAGRGIEIIASIATSWGSRRTPGGGKAVWCEFALPR
ncbi:MULTISPECIES: ATP-binding SpoIIE family protein phosphatase [Streptomyces]|uniref:ATP-binding SpoIIE family protein phosphatase n=1 Tax=Streptomyces TaxID=1883 RepID=UPI0010391BFD|nr:MULTISPECIES: ATP-binding SpoIIE family protein phosphatase [Streptomyces]MBT3076732.1 serine/threonine-protein phosphatase [Streptomyces sp. COG21]MBT3082050.1 serine/threonine-protein phosphatase [Streptomyces sp. COG20]MBT3100314.1 serine/threonine-protein phosphatase [Streptomyces sp. CBG30]MBT3104018.1 serine/threonine-protein phosphatase [Streptomyces sp. COG19]MBT3107386.1 serine/threonine-protein phosphatase [Streptomyces sp. COG19]